MKTSYLLKRFFAVPAVALIVVLTACGPEAANKTTNSLPANYSNSNRESADAPVKYEDKRTEMHHRLDALIGEWDVEKTNTIVPGFSPEKPLVSKGTIVTRRRWLEKAGYYFIEDETEGKFGTFDYYRHGILGYSVPDDRFEWNTVDNFNPMMMTYKGAPNSGRIGQEISISGEYTDQGMLGERYKGKSIGQRTVFRIESNDRHRVELYFTPPGEKERLVDTMIYTRRK
jgi:hypothetical protein